MFENSIIFDNIIIEDVSRWNRERQYQRRI